MPAMTNVLNRQNKSVVASLLAALLIVTLVAVLSGCGRGNAYILVPQQWDETEFIVEIRPGAPRPGMNEFVVIATGLDRVPAYQYVISIQLVGGERWAQMIQDGHSGVYRRAIAVKDPANDILHVKIEHSNTGNPNNRLAEHKLLTFPLAHHVGGPTS